MGKRKSNTPIDSQGGDSCEDRGAEESTLKDMQRSVAVDLSPVYKVVATAFAAAHDPTKIAVCAGAIEELTDYIVNLHVGVMSQQVKESRLESRVEGTEYWLLRLAEAVQKQKERRAKAGSKGADMKWNNNPNVAPKAERDRILAQMVALKREKPNWSDRKVAEYVKKRHTLSTSLETLRSRLNKELNRLTREVK